MVAQRRALRREGGSGGQCFQESCPAAPQPAVERGVPAVQASNPATGCVTAVPAVQASNPATSNPAPRLFCEEIDHRFVPLQRPQPALLQLCSPFRQLHRKRRATHAVKAARWQLAASMASGMHHSASIQAQHRPTWQAPRTTQPSRASLPQHNMPTQACRVLVTRISHSRPAQPG